LTLGRRGHEVSLFDPGAASSAWTGGEVESTHGFRDACVGDSVAARRELVVYAKRQLGEHADSAEDVVQDAYLHLMNRTIAGDPPEQPRAWLYTVVRSRCRDELVRQRERPSSAIEEIAASGGGPDEAMIVAAEGRWMLEQVDALPTRERDAVVAHLSGRRPAARGQSANASYQALFRGRARLREAYKVAWSGGLLPIGVMSRWGRRALASQFAPSAFKGSAGIVRTALIGTAAVAAGIGGPPVVHYVQHASSGHRRAVVTSHPGPAAATFRGARVYETDLAGGPTTVHRVVVQSQVGTIASTRGHAGEPGDTHSGDALSGDQSAAQPDQSQGDARPPSDLQPSDGGSVTPELQQQAPTRPGADQPQAGATNTDGGGAGGAGGGSPSGN
jgi:RNA polymerase sigma factor (sigma-70 family)